MEPIQKKFDLYSDLTFWSIFGSSIVILFITAFECRLSIMQNKTIKTLFYSLVIITGIVAMALSVDAFLLIQNMTTKPLECKDILKKFRIFFILSMSIGVAQTVFTMYILKGMYFKSI